MHTSILNIFGKEIVFLHCQQCIDGVNSCSDLLPGYDSEMVNSDREIWHAAVVDFISGGVTCTFGHQ